MCGRLLDSQARAEVELLWRGRPQGGVEVVEDEVAVGEEESDNSDCVCIVSL